MLGLQACNTTPGCHVNPVLFSTSDSGSLQRRKGLAGGGGDRVVGQVFAAGLAHCVGSDVAVLAGLCLSLLAQANALRLLPHGL